MNKNYPKYSVGNQVVFNNGSGMIMKIVEIGKNVFRYFVRTTFGIRCLGEDEITILNC